MTKIADKFGASSSGKANATNKLSDDLKKKRNQDTKSIEDHYTSIKRATKSTDSLVDSFTSAAKGFAGLWVIGEIVKYGKENVDTYRELSKAGQSFGGSMINMTHAAASAGLPLQTFAKIIKDNSNIVNQLGTKTFFQMNKTLRDSIESQGLYGYSLEELGDLQGTYMEQQRMAGKSMQYIGSQQNQKNLSDFAANIVDVSAALGNQRDAVMKNYQAATDSAEFAGALRLNEARGLGDYNKAMQEAIVSVGAQLGEAGSMLSKGLAQAFTLPGGANFSELGKQFVKAGLGGGVALMDEAKQRIAAGENQSTVTMETMNAMAKMVQNPANVAALELQAQAGNDAAIQILQLTKNMKVYTQADLDAKAKERNSMDTFTAFFESFESIFDKLKGSFIDGFLKPFGEKSGSFKAFWDGLDGLTPVVTNLGESLGDWAHSFFTADNLKNVGQGIVTFINVAKTLTMIATGMIKFLTPVVQVLGGVFGLFIKGLNTIDSWLSKVNNKFADLTTALIAVAALFGAKKLTSMFLGAFSNPKLMTVKAGIVNISSGGLGLGKGGKGIGGLVGKELGGLGGQCCCDGAGSALDGMGGGSAASKAEKAAAREAAAMEKGIAKGLEGEALEKFVAKSKLGIGGRALGLLGKIPGVSKLGGLAGGLIEKTGLGSLTKGAGGLLKGAGGALGGLAEKIGIGGLLKGAGSSVPLLGALVSGGISGADEFGKSGNLAKALFAGTGAAGGTLLGQIGGTAVGGPVGEVLGAIGGGVAGQAGADALYDKIFGKDTSKNKTPDAPNAAGNDPANPKPVDITKLPTFSDEELAQLRTNAILGDQKSAIELNKIQEALKQQTIVLYSVQQKTLAEQRKATAAAAAQQGY